MRFKVEGEKGSACPAPKPPLKGGQGNKSGISAAFLGPGIQRTQALPDLRRALADVPEITAWSEPLWGAGGPWTRPLPVDEAVPSIPKAERAPVRMPTTADQAALIARDGRHCRFCGIPSICAEVRKALHRAYPDAARWGDRNAEQHAGLQAMWLQFDHFLPHARGGRNDLGNMLVTCAPCNCGRSNLALAEAGLADPRIRSPVASVCDGVERLLSRTACGEPGGRRRMSVGGTGAMVTG